MTLEKLREEIDSIDDQILNLFLKRMEVVGQVAENKKERNIGVSNKKREREILSRVSAKAGKHEVYARALFSTLFDVSSSYQNGLLTESTVLSDKIDEAIKNTPALFPQSGIIACQGLEGSYSSLACDKLFPMANIMYFSNFDAVFGAVESGLCAYGILPVENSSYGSVSEVYDLMRTKSFNIVRSVKLHINHALLVKQGTKLSDIKEIISHEQSLGQCSEFLRGLKNVKITACENNAVAADYVAKSEDCVAAIASPSCAEYYGLEILDVKLLNSDNNYTRFICISKKPEIYPGSNRISLMLTLPHEPGSLYRLVGKFSALGLNLDKLESRPISGRDFEFMFYFDFEASVIDEKVKSLLNQLANSNSSFVFLGNYLEV